MATSETTIKVSDDDMATLSRLLICDLESGQCLFEREWTSQKDNADAVVRLIQVFYQFAREMKEGELQRVTFGPPETLSTRSELAGRIGIVAGRSGSFSLAGSGATRHTHGRRRSRQKAALSLGRRDPELCLTCDKDDYLVAALFHSHDLDAATGQLICSSLIKSFRTQFDSQLEDICQQLRALPPDEPTMPADLSTLVVSTFLRFDIDRVLGRVSDTVDTDTQAQAEAEGSGSSVVTVVVSSSDGDDGGNTDNKV